MRRLQLALGPFATPPPSPRPPRQSTTPWRADTSGARNPRHTNNRGGSNTHSFRGRGGHSSRGHSSQPSRTPPRSASFRQPPAHRGHSRGRANSSRQYTNRNSSRRSGSRGRAGSSSARRGRQSGRSFLGPGPASHSLLRRGWPLPNRSGPL